MIYSCCLELFFNLHVRQIKEHTCFASNILSGFASFCLSYIMYLISNYQYKNVYKRWATYSYEMWSK